MGVQVKNFFSFRLTSKIALINTPKNTKIPLNVVNSRSSPTAVNRRYALLFRQHL